MTPKLKIETWPIGKVLNYAKNARLHSEEQVALVVKSIKEFGFVNPCLVDADGVLIAGHCRILASKKLGMKTVPVIKLGHLTEQQARALRIADNAIPISATWDQVLMKIELESLQLADYDMTLLGFEDFQLAEFLTPPNAGLVDPDEVPEPPKKPVVRKGDLWMLGEHRLLCGDSTSTKDVARLMEGKTARLMNTDAPYGIAYDSSAIHANGVDYGEIENDDTLDGEKLQAFLEEAIRAAAPFLAKDAAFYLWHPMLTQGTFFAAAAAAAAAADILISRQIIWIKPVLVFGRGDYHWKHELCFYGWRRGHKPKFYGERNQTTVWEVDSVSHADRKTFAHGTPKPVELFVRPINNHTKHGDVCYEPFAGTGPQIIAAEMTGRVCCAMEIDPRHVETCILRWQT